MHLPGPSHSGSGTQVVLRGADSLGIGVEIMGIEKISDALTEIHATIYCEREAHKGIIIGRQGSMLQTIGTEARTDIEKLLDTHVNLKLWVKIRTDWRNNPADLRNLGYDK